MAQKKMIRVRPPAGEPRLYPVPGVPGSWVGWEPCPREQAEHVIEGAAGLAQKAGPRGFVYDAENTTSDLFGRGPDVHLRRVPGGALIEEDADVRRALRCGDLERLCERCQAGIPYGQEDGHACPPAPASGGK